MAELSPSEPQGRSVTAAWRRDSEDAPGVVSLRGVGAPTGEVSMRGVGASEEMSMRGVGALEEVSMRGVGAPSEEVSMRGVVAPEEVSIRARLGWLIVRIEEGWSVYVSSVA